MSVIPRLAAGAAALLLGTALATVALPASAAPAAATHTVTYSSLPPSLSSPGTVLVGQTIAFKNGSAIDSITVSSTQGGWALASASISIPPGQTSAPVAVPSAGPYSYKVVETVAALLRVPTASGSFTATSAPSSGGSAQPPNQSSGGGSLLGLGSQPMKPPAGGSSGGSGHAGGSGGAASSGSGSSGALSFGDAGGSGSGSGSFDSSRFGTGSGDFPNLPGGVFAPVVPQAGSTGGGLAPDIAADPSAGGADGAFGGTSSATTPGQATDTITTASQNSGSGSSVTGPAAIAAALMALVTIGLARAWSTHPPFQRR